TLSPEGATEATAEGLPVLLGDASRTHTLFLAGADRAKVLVVPDDDPAMAHRVTSVARITNPTMRIIVRTRYIAETDPLHAAGADRVIAEELEGIVQLFADVMRSYDLPPEEIERHEETVRSGGYAALREEGRPASPLVECELGADCLARRTVTIRAGAPAEGLTVGQLPLTVERLDRGPLGRTRPPGAQTNPAGGAPCPSRAAPACRRRPPRFRAG